MMLWAHNSHVAMEGAHLPMRPRNRRDSCNSTVTPRRGWAVASKEMVSAEMEPFIGSYFPGPPESEPVRWVPSVLSSSVAASFGPKPDRAQWR
jgi:hypothetical protein